MPKHGAKASLTLSQKEMRRENRLDALRLGPKEPVITAPFPRTRAECVDSCRPCPFVSCKHHLYLDVNDIGSIVISHPDVQPREMHISCALDVADDGPISLEQVGSIMNITRERVRQLEVIALNALAATEVMRGAA